MNAQRSDILKLIYAAITKQRMELSVDFSIRSIMPIIKEHNIIALCYYGAVECGLDTYSPEMRALFNYVCRYIYNNERQNYVVEEIFATFEKNGIEYMPLKGILLKELYPSPEMRVMGDLDILIRTEQYPQIQSLFHALNYTEITESDHELIWNRNGVLIELHKRLIPSYNKDYYSYFEDGWRLAKISTGTKHQMTDEDQLIYLFTHFAKHYRDGGIGIRQMVDLWIYRRNNTVLDESYLKRELTALSLYDFYKNIYDTLAVWFEQGQPNEITELITDTIFNSGVFGTNEAHVLSEGVKIETTSDKPNANAKAIKLFRSLFLPYSSMCKKYSFLKRIPILLPIMWIVRWLEAIFIKRNRIGKTIDDLKLMSDQNINTHKNNLERVGLSFNFKEQ